MKTIQNLLILALSSLTLLGCVTHEKVASINTTNMNSKNIPIIHTNTSIEETENQAEYGHYTDEIQQFLATTPMGSEIHLEQKESGEWYLKVEKTFAVQKNQEKTEMIEPIYGESILI